MNAQSIKKINNYKYLRVNIVCLLARHCKRQMEKTMIKVMLCFFFPTFFLHFPLDITFPFRSKQAWVTDTWTLVSRRRSQNDHSSSSAAYPGSSRGGSSLSRDPPDFPGSSYRLQFVRRDPKVFPCQLEDRGWIPIPPFTLNLNPESWLFTLSVRAIFGHLNAGGL